MVDQSQSSGYCWRCWPQPEEELEKPPVPFPQDTSLAARHSDCGLAVPVAETALNTMLLPEICLRIFYLLQEQHRAGPELALSLF